MFRILSLSFVLLFPTIVFASPTATYELIAPIGSLTNTPVTLQQYLEGAFQTIIGIAGILAVLMLVICGIKLMGTGSVSAKSEAKQCIWNAIFGLLLAIGSWVLLNTINPLLLRSDAEIAVQAPESSAAAPTSTTNDPLPTNPGWYFRYKNPSGRIVNSIRIDSSSACIQLKDMQNTEAPGSVEKNAQGLECFEIPSPKSMPTGSETSARQSICGNDSCVSNSNSGVFINKSSCVNGQTQGCTNVTGIPGNVVSMLKSLNGSCGCDVTISGGTEGGHASHGVGLPMLDIRHTSAVDAIVKSDPSSKRTSFQNKKTGDYYYEWLWNGWWFTDEGDHWHVCPVGQNNTYCRPK